MKDDQINIIRKLVKKLKTAENVINEFDKQIYLLHGTLVDMAESSDKEAKQYKSCAQSTLDLFCDLHKEAQKKIPALREFHKSGYLEL